MPETAEELIGLKEAATHYYGGRVTDKTLRLEFARHNIALIYTGGKYFCTASDIAALQAASRRLPSARGEKAPCRDADRQLVSTSASASAEPPSGSSSMDRAKLAQVQAQRTVNALKRPLPTTAQTSTPRQVVSLRHARSISRRS